MPSFPNDYYADKQAIRDSKDSLIENLGNDKHFLCDFCSKGVNFSSSPTIGMYLADEALFTNNPRAEIINENRILAPISSYCEDCTPPQLLFPCEGVCEARVKIELDSHASAENLQFLDISGPEDGIPWEPLDLVEKITTLDPDLLKQVHPDMTWGPELVVTFFLSLNSNVDIRELVNWDGSYNPDKMDQAREAFHEAQEKLRDGNFSREEFRKHVEGQ